MELTVLGANGTFPTPGMGCSGYLLHEEGHTVWMDAGSGTLGELQRHVSPFELDAVYLSHVHVDHCADVFPFFYMRMLHQDLPPLPIYAPRGTRAKLETLIGDESRAAFNSLLAWQELEPGETVEVGPMRFDTFDAAHSAPNNTARITAGGKTFCYSGDTGPSEYLARAARGADVFLCEASWLESDIGLMSPIHLTAREAGQAGREAGVARLILTHLWPRNDRALVREQAGETYGADIELAVEQGRITI